MKAITDKIAWRFLIPRYRYFRNLRIAHKVPEVKGQINRQAFLKAAEYAFYLVWSPLFLVVVVLFVIYWSLERFLKPGRFPIIPPFDDWHREAVKEAWSIVPLDTIRERLGEEVPRILTEKSDTPS